MIRISVAYYESAILLRFKRNSTAFTINIYTFYVALFDPIIMKNDAFISHSSKDIKLATSIRDSLQVKGVKIWLDDSDIQYGELLRGEIQSTIRNSRVLVLLWSKDSSESRWVKAELFVAFHSNRFIIPLILDETLLPEFLQNSVYRDVRKKQSKFYQALYNTIDEAPRHANEILPSMDHYTGEQNAMIQRIKKMQDKESQFMNSNNPNLRIIRDTHVKVNDLMRVVQREKWGHFLKFLNLAGYHKKNAYLIKHWDAMEEGSLPKDNLLLGAERCFFEALFRHPNDPSSLNGLGSVLIVERELKAAEFFIKIAIRIAEQQGLDYEAA